VRSVRGSWVQPPNHSYGLTVSLQRTPWGRLQLTLSSQLACILAFLSQFTQWIISKVIPGLLWSRDMCIWLCHHFELHLWVSQQRIRLWIKTCRYIILEICRLQISLTSLLQIKISDDPHESTYYPPHSLFIQFFTLTLESVMF